MEKRARKAQMKMQYKAWAEAGITHRSKRAKANKIANRKVRVNRRRQKLPFPFHLWLRSDGTLRAGSPHAAYLAMREAA
jgi:hypothetical protein